MFSERIDRLQPSPIREILSVIDRPGMVSFAGGLPASETLPDWSGTASADVLQYGPSEGEPALRQVVSERLRSLGVDAPPERVMILGGSQQGIDLVAKLFIDRGTPVAVESPTYLAALQVFRLYGARFVDLDVLGENLARLAYVIPTFANPTGACASDAERDELARRCLSAGTVLFEDDPYRDLAYDDCDRRPVASRMSGGSWVYQGSFSKTFAPGLRLGYLAASAELFPRLVMLKQALDLHTSRLSQSIVLEAVTDPGWDARVEGLVRFYSSRRDAFESAMRRHLGDLAEWHTPRGGLFYWLRLNEHIDTRPLLAEAIRRNVAFMPGEEFFPNEPVLGTMRLNFSHASGDDADRGLATLAGLLRDRTR
ncbi:PLP-dependent aminotransferase family protein [Humibacter ginsenosidimutans]|nr:PLP-dependent aminotransferase family protein [Humibacter ginsenosidimutans]